MSFGELAETFDPSLKSRKVTYQLMPVKDLSNRRIVERRSSVDVVKFESVRNSYRISRELCSAPTIGNNGVATISHVVLQQTKTGSLTHPLTQAAFERERCAPLARADRDHSVIDSCFRTTCLLSGKFSPLQLKVSAYGVV